MVNDSHSEKLMCKVCVFGKEKGQKINRRKREEKKRNIYNNKHAATHTRARAIVHLICTLSSEANKVKDIRVWRKV